ncbi:MAG: WG repeat-containing protein [Bacteroidota bacterium]
MKYFLLAIFLVSALFSVKAQAFPPALTQKFNITRKLTDEYFVFEKNGKSGVVNKSGAIILSAAYPGIYNTMYDLFVVRNDVAQGVVKAKDITVLPLAFEEIDILSPQRIHVRKNGISFIVSPSNQFLADTTEGPTTLFQMDGNMLTSPGILAEVELAAFKANNFLKMDGAVFMIKGKDTTRTAYQDIQPLANNGSRIKFKQNERWGIIDNDGRELVPAMYDDIEQDDHTGLTKVSREKKQSLLDRELKPLPAGPFDRIGYFTSSDIAVMSNDSKEGLINSSGTILLYPVKGTIREYGNQFFEIRYDTVEKTDIVDRNMKSILPAGTFMKGYVGNIILVITADKKMGVVHAAGYTLLQPVYDEVFFGNTDGEDIRFFQVRKDTKWGILDLAGKQLIPYLYDKINLFSDGYAPAILNGKGGVITEKKQSGSAIHL